MRTIFILALLLTLLTCTVFWQTGNHDFLFFDDNEYVVNNQHVNTGLSGENIAWAFTARYSANWHPLTWLSHMVDIELFGLKPQGHHLVNVALHATNALLLFLLFCWITGYIWRSFFVAAIFALHPVHVESIAWIAERKDLLSSFFGLLTLFAYVNWTQRAGIGRYLVCLGCFVLGLLSKPMLVTLPFLMLVLDYWPLNRLTAKVFKRLFWEKLPLFALSITSSIITLLAQQNSGAVASLAITPLSIRMENAVLSYAGYIGKMLWPSRLAVFYPISSSFSLWKVATAGLFIIAISIYAFRQPRQHPYLITGWLWYIGTLVPVIGFVQVGEQAMADRYTYLPTVGLSIMAVWGISEMSRQWHNRRSFFIIAGTMTIFLMAGLTWRQAGFWKNTRTLFNHAADVVPNNYLAKVALGNVLLEEGNYTEAIRNFNYALQLKPNQAIAHSNLALALAATGELESALFHYDTAITINPRFPEAYYNKGTALARLKRFDESAAMSRIAISLRPDYSEAYNNLGCALLELGRPADAAEEFQKALRLNPNYIDALKNFNLTLRSTVYPP